MSVFLVLRAASSTCPAGSLTRLRNARSFLVAGGQSYRAFLSPAYSCDDLWRAQRTQCESLKHITPERYFFELNQRYQQKQPVSPVDVDIYVNSVHKVENQDELEHIVKRFRSTKLTVGTLDSTHHAVCRFYLQNGKRDQLLKLLNERVQYGIFPDSYICNVLMDQAIKDGALEDAFEVVKLMMLQEDSGNTISKTLALHTLTQLLATDVVGPKAAAEGEVEAQEEAAEEDEDDIEYIRVPYLTNPYFDDHFDITNREHLFGKSLYFFGRELGQLSEATEQDQVLSASAQITGLIFYQKWDKLTKLLDRLQSSKSSITVDPLEIAQKHAELINDETIQTELKKVINRLQSMPQVQDRLQSLVAARVAAASALEPSDIEAQKQLFAQFETARHEAIKSQLDTLLRAQKKREIEAKEAELEQKKRLYYFFENFPKHEIDFVEAEKRIKEIQEKTVIDEDYIPPENY